jgi:hypothetical protein
MTDSMQEADAQPDSPADSQGRGVLVECSNIGSYSSY